MPSRRSQLGTEPPASEITPETRYFRRREFIRNTALFAAMATAVGGGLRFLVRGRRVTDRERAQTVAAARAPLPIAARSEYAGGEALTLGAERPILVATLKERFEGWLPAYMADAAA